MRTVKNLYLTATLSAIVAAIVVAATLYLLGESFNVSSILIIAVAIWVGTFLSYKVSGRATARRSMARS